MDKNEIVQKMEALIAKAEGENRDLTAEEEMQYRGLDMLLTEAKADEDKPKKTIQLSHREESKPGAGYSERGIIGGLARPDKFFRSRGQKSDRTMGQYLADVITGKTLVPGESREMELGTGALGGFSAPEAWARGFWAAVNNESVFLPRCRMFDFQGANVLHITAWDSENQTAGPFGGVSAQWVAEGGTFTAVDPNIRAMILKAAKLGIYVDVTREASQNATALVQELGQQMTRACVYEVDRCIMNGTGIGQPLGVLNAGSAIDVTRAGAGAIDYADITGMYRRLYPGFLKGAAWFASPDAIEQLLTLQDPASQYIWVPSVDGVANSRPGFLLGLPLYLTDKCPALGTRGDLVLADLGAYAVAVAQEVRLEKTDSARWYNDIYSFRAIMRMDGQALMDNEITPRNGGTSLSWAVVLN